MERISSQIEAVKVVGEEPCPNGCGNTSRRVLIFGTVEVVEACLPCQEAHEARMAEEERVELQRFRLRRAGATPVYLDWSLDSYPTDEVGVRARGFAEMWLKRYADGVRENVLIFGPQGGGKTGLAWAALRHVIEEFDGSGVIVTWREALEVMKDSFRHGQPTVEMQRLKRTPVLVLDDVGSERPTDFARQELLSLVDHRMLNKLPTWFTSNFAPDKLADRLGHDDPIIGRRIVSRMAGGAVQFRVDVDDRRVAAA